jgi:hypothetical protein
MRPINFLKTSLAAAALVLGTASVARANQIADGTYSIDGICFTFQDDNLVSWNSIDSHGGGALTDANGFLCSTGVLGANAWYFTVNENSIIDKYSGICADGGSGGEGGTTTGSNSVPDNSGTFGLVLGGLIAIVGSRFLVGRRTSRG